MAGNAAVAGFSDRHQSVAQLYCAPLLEAHERVPALRSVEEPAKKQRKRLLAATASSHLWRPAGPWGAPLLSRLSEKAVHPGRDRQGAELRHSREVTQVCSPKVTRRIGEKGPVAGIMHGTRGSARPREARNLHAFGVDEIAGLISCPGARPVLRLGHSERANLGHFSRAPRERTVRGHKYVPLLFSSGGGLRGHAGPCFVARP